jgi:integrase
MIDKPERIRIGYHVTIYPRGKKAIWIADFFRNGQHCRQSLKTANKRIAIARAQKLEAELASGTFEQPPPALTVAQAVEDYLAYHRTEGRASKTLVKYRGVLTTLCDFLASQRVTRLHEFTATHFDRFRAARKRNHHVKTMYLEGVLVKQLMKWCKSRKLIRENAISDFKLVKPPLMPKDGPTMVQINSILTSSRGQFMVMLALLAFTGMRSGELQRLRKEDLDLLGNWLHVVSRSGLETKTRHSRKIPLHSRLRPLVEKLPKVPGPWLFAAEVSAKFPHGDHWISTRKLNERFKSLLKQLGLRTGRVDGFTIHSLRHSFETTCVNAGIPQRVIDAWLGHSADKSMAAVYYKLTDEDSQAFIKKVPFGTGKPAADAGMEEKRS